jgi:hypothetical protein
MLLQDCTRHIGVARKCRENARVRLCQVQFLLATRNHRRPLELVHILIASVVLVKGAIATVRHDAVGQPLGRPRILDGALIIGSPGPAVRGDASPEPV